MQSESNEKLFGCYRPKMHKLLSAYATARSKIHKLLSATPPPQQSNAPSSRGRWKASKETQG